METIKVREMAEIFFTSHEIKSVQKLQVYSVAVKLTGDGVGEACSYLL